MPALSPLEARGRNRMSDPSIAMPGVPWVEKVDTRTGRGCSNCLWPMPSNATFEAEVSAVGPVDIIHVRVIAMRFACPGCGVELCFKIGR